MGEYPHLVTIDPQHAGINTAISEGFSSVERRASSRQEAHETVIKKTIIISTSPTCHPLCVVLYQYMAHSANT